MDEFLYEYSRNIITAEIATEIAELRNYLPF